MKFFKFLILIILIVLVFGLGCSDDRGTNPPLPGNAELPISLSLEPAVRQGYGITRVRVTITRDDYINSLNLTIVDTTAYGTFSGLEEGIYEISVEAYEGEMLVATGSGVGEVVAGEIATVEITLQFVVRAGDLEIIVRWGSGAFDPPERLLFVGNSYTASNLGLDLHIRNLAISADSTLRIETARITPGGYTLEAHWNSPTTISTIQSGEWDLVFLQEQSMRPVSDPELMYEYATLLDGVITDSGAETGFFMTWARQYNPPMIEDLAAAYNHIGAELDAVVSPAGRAFQRAILQDPEISLYMADGSHPSPHGTYLAACVFYAIIWHQTPIGLSYTIDEYITEEETLFLQTIAWKTVEIYNNL